MKPESRSKRLLAMTRSRAKMYEYEVPEPYFIKIPKDPARLFDLCIGILGDLTALINSKNPNENDISSMQTNLRFSAHFFDSYLQAELEKELNPFLFILGSASYYLSNLPGSAHVLAMRLKNEFLDLEGGGLEGLLLCILQDNYLTETNIYVGKYIGSIREIKKLIGNFFDNGNLEAEEKLLANISRLREVIYFNGTDLQLLLIDIISAVVRMKLKNSSMKCLPIYTGINIDKWQPLFQQKNFIKELWPSQHLMGKQGIFQGKSGIIQMPTSAGKTKATELILRSAFLADRTSLAVIVAPFKALCHEIKNSLSIAFKNEPISVDELSDSNQKDFDISFFLGKKQCIIVTPEKLVYVIRHSPDFVNDIGVMIYDEGHQFDNGNRGITYELLLTSLKDLIPGNVQVVLISAVISNAEDIGEWLIGENNELVSGTDLLPTYRTVAFVSWQDKLGSLEFVSSNNPEQSDFYVPRVIEAYPLKHNTREKERIFPNKTSSASIALYLSIKLVAKGSVAIFCGTKKMIPGICEQVVDAFERDVPLPFPVEVSDKEEIDRLHFLSSSNLGQDEAATKCVKLGILNHHGNAPHGIRLSVEYAMKTGKAKCVICTSTLAQGVNLPIRYLILTNLNQGSTSIKVRDFHNLIGRTGRSGMYTEGSIIFADPKIYDRRRSNSDKWRWRNVKELLDAGNSEACGSTLLQIFEPFKCDDKKTNALTNIEILDLLRMYFSNVSDVDTQIKEIAELNNIRPKIKCTAKNLKEQLMWRINITSAVESYLMTYWNESELEDDEIKELAEETLAYSLAIEEDKENITKLFHILAKHIVDSVPEKRKRKSFGKTMFGVKESIEIENWVNQNANSISQCGNITELLIILWPIISINIHNKSFTKCDNPSVLIDICTGWIKGLPFYELFNIVKTLKVKLKNGKNRVNYKIDQIVDVCENALAYEGELVLSAVVELYELIHPEEQDVLENIKGLQKMFKYGLTSPVQIMLYELGFSDRAVATDLSSIFDGALVNKATLVKQIKQKKVNVERILDKYPSYFNMILNEIIN